MNIFIFWMSTTAVCVSTSFIIWFFSFSLLTLELKCFLSLKYKIFSHFCTHQGSCSTMVFRIFSTPMPVFAEIYSQTMKKWIYSLTRDKVLDKQEVSLRSKNNVWVKVQKRVNILPVYRFQATSVKTFSLQRWNG